MARLFSRFFPYRLIEPDGGPKWSNRIIALEMVASALAEMLRARTRFIDRSFADRSVPGLLKRRRERVR
jgi:hypothetical protein